MHKCKLTDAELRDALAKHEEMLALAGGPPNFTLHTQNMADALRELLDFRQMATAVPRFVGTVSDADLNALASHVGVIEPFEPSERMSKFSELERGLAYDQAAGNIDGMAAPERDDDDPGAPWRDVDNVAGIEGAAEEIADAVRYLDLRGLIERHPDHSNWVQVRDEDEPGTPVLPTNESATTNQE